MNKDEIKTKILFSVIASEISKGHLKWKVSDIARGANVSRPLIYYHFGKTKKEILSECLNVIAEEYYGLSEDRQNMVKQGNLLGSMMKTRKMFLENPSLAVFYQRWRMKEGNPVFKQQLIDIENRYQEKLQSIFPHLSSDEVSVVHAIFHGLIIAPFITEQQLARAVQFIQPILGKQ